MVILNGDNWCVYFEGIRAALKASVTTGMFLFVIAISREWCASPEVLGILIKKDSLRTSPHQWSVFRTLQGFYVDLTGLEIRSTHSVSWVPPREHALFSGEILASLGIVQMWSGGMMYYSNTLLSVSAKPIEHSVSFKQGCICKGLSSSQNTSRVLSVAQEAVREEQSMCPLWIR